VLVLVNVIVYIATTEESYYGANMANLLKVAVFFTMFVFTLLFSACKDEKTEVDNEVSDTFENNDEATDFVETEDKVDIEDKIDDVEQNQLQNRDSI
jgi:hypothetical protein